MTQPRTRTGPRHAQRPPRPRPRLRGDIEGLRAIAVLLVLLYHLGVDAFSGGFAGVDVFFVISGFLITSHLLSEVEASGTVRLARFYARRAKRLLPAATVVLVFTAVVGYFVLPVVEHRNLATDVFLAAVYVVNWGLAARSVDYLAEDADLSPLQHYWSLSVEEQFYLVVPVLLIAAGWWAARRHLPVRRTAGWVVLALTVTSLAWSVWHTATSAQTAYFVTTTRVWELAVGSLLACLLPALTVLRRPTAQVLALLGIGLVAWTAFVTDRTTPWPGSAALLPVLGTALVIAAGCSTQATVVGRLLGVRPMVWLGGLSYAIYLWHWPLIVFADALGLGGRLVAVGLLVLTIGLSVLSQRLVEDPIRFGPVLAGAPWRALAMGVAGMSVSALAAVAVWTTVPQLGERPSDAAGAEALPVTPPVAPGPGADPTPEPDADPPPDEETAPPAEPTFPTTGPVHPDPNVAPEDVPVVYADGCQTAQSATEVSLDCVYGDPDGETVVAVVGDSKMAQWMSPLIAIAEAEGWRLETYLKSACGLNPARGEADYPACSTWVDNVVSHLTGDGRVDVVIGSMGTSGDAKDENRRSAYVQGHLEVWQALEGAGTRVVMLTDTPLPMKNSLADGESVYECVAANLEDWSGCTFPANPGSGTPAIVSAAEEMPSVEVIDLNPWVCPAKECPPVIGGLLVYRQGSHITDSYASSLQRQLWEHLIEVDVADGPAAGPEGDR